jgi:U3 small nucleolar RNA-associated protein 22
VPSFGDGLALLRIWADRRGYGAGHTLRRGRGSDYCVVGFEGLGAWWTCILEVLILGEESYSENGGEKGKKKGQRPSVGKGLSSYQLFRAALDFLGESELYIGDCVILRAYSARRDFQTEPLLMKMAEHGQRVRFE